ncbi:MAG TPA: NAD-dependent deacylase [Polyangia bacterium]|nr:NAD-dependent deacylase [Polyangia bacterium]
MSAPDRGGATLRLDEDTWLLVLTGAGVSAESGIPTFRDAGGLWEQHRVEEVASPEGFAADPRLVWRFYAERRRKAKTCAPNPGHAALARAEEALGDRFLLATQNVDGLHRRAGSRRLVELHGNLFTSRCADCARAPFADETEPAEPPRCDACGGRLRPHIVWFGEMLDPDDLWRVKQFMRKAERGRFVFLAAGTSGAVWPAAGFVDDARMAGAETWLVNLEPPENASRFQRFVSGPSGRVLPELLNAK